MNLRLKHIEVFNAVMLTGSVSAAARLLHVTQPAVTQTLQHAELQLGYALFTRDRRRLVATREAQTLYPEVQALMLQLESVRRLAAALRGGDGGPFRILIVPSLAVKALPDALRVFRKRHPKLPVQVRTLHSNEIARAIALQEGDVGIVYGKLPHPALHDDLVATGRLVCVSLREPGTDRRTTVTMQDVLREPFIRIDERDPLGAVLADQWARLGLVPRAGMTVQTHHIAMVMAEQGFGPAIIDSFTAQAGASARLHVRTLLPVVPVEVRVLQPQGVRSPRTVNDFLAAFREATNAEAP
jgi:DNA-binding transcriptional LysR family regulator